MTRRKTIVGLCLLCALAASALAAQGASASKGTTAFTCKKTEKGGAGFSKAHCKAADAVGSGAAYEHVAIAEGTQTEISGTNEKTGSNTESTPSVKLKNTLAGVTYEVNVGKVSGLGTVTNAKDPETGEHYVHGTAKVTFEELTLNPSSCKVEGGKITSKELKVTTKGQGDFVKFEPAEGNVLTEYTITGCPELNATWKMYGTVKCPADGATVICTHNTLTSEKTLREGSPVGAISGIEGSMTLSAKDPTAGDKEFTALSATTVETP
ncbi:MAG TPA: hypothetical protein VLL27_11245 [Solirubrobacterales bacterium]|nr:hypothetical protein [Solirubrobacterales bacterium]